MAVAAGVAMVPPVASHDAPHVVDSTVSGCRGDAMVYTMGGTMVMPRKIQIVFNPVARAGVPKERFAATQRTVAFAHIRTDHTTLYTHY